MPARLPYVCADRQKLFKFSQRPSITSIVPTLPRTISTRRQSSSNSLLRAQPTRLKSLHPSQRRHRSTLPDAPVRTRFAPSPTGSLHLGSLRTALFNYLLARSTHGQFLLRLEDTDAKRTVPGAEDSLYADLQWAGLQWDEGPLVGGKYGPYRQSERTELYQRHAAQLLENGGGYRCFCSAERLDELGRRRKELGLPTDYDRLCASLSKEESDEREHRGESHVVRLLSPASYPPFTDLVYGRVGKSNTGANVGITHKHGEVAYEDPVLLKSDGSPTYHLANVVDDHAMGITHVVRATEWISSTPKHLALYQAFGWEPPAYAHVGLLVDREGRKLSKRAMDTSLSSLREQGWLKEAVVNFAALLGCSYERRDDVMTLEELVQEFKMKFTKGNAVVTEEKLRFLQRAHAEKAVNAYKDNSSAASYEVNETMAQIIKDVTECLHGWSLQRNQDEQLEERTEKDPEGQIRKILTHDARNYTSPSQFLQRNKLLFAHPSKSDIEGALTPLVGTNTSAVFWLIRSLDQFEKSVQSKDQTAEELDESVREACTALQHDYALPEDLSERQDWTSKQYYSYWCKALRAMLVAGNHGPGLGATMEILSEEAVRSRLHIAREILHKIC